jgi:phosphonate transport system ATP-binding protein
MISLGTETGAAFDLESVCATFGGTRALQEVSLSIAPGEAVAFVGPSGAGKTTLLRLLNGSLRPTAGRVRVDGLDLADAGRSALKALRASIGFIHQDLGLVPTLRVSQNVLAGRFGRQTLLGSLRSMVLPPRRETERVDALLTRVGIAEKIYERTDRLSGGERQRVALARALYQGPRALLADEPVSSVDPARARDTVELLTRISREERLTLGMSIHNLDLARACFGRLVGLRAGRLVFDKPAAEIGEAEFRALYDLTPAAAHADGP